ncbi:MAG: hypothetical protein ACK54F_03385 [Planctomycetia bacterium]|jgi:hypothetical protein
MNQQTDTQEVVDLSGDALANILRGQSSLAGPPPVDRQENKQPAATEAAPAQPAAEAQSAPVAAPVQQEQPAPVANTGGDSAANDPYATMVANIVGDQSPEINVAWTDEAKNLFKQTYGVEDPIAYKKELDSKLAESQLYKQKYDEVAPVLGQLEKLPPTMYRALQLALEGKVDDAQDYLKSLPKIALENKESKSLEDRLLIDTYLPGKIKPEQWDMLNDPEADEDTVDAIESRIAILRDTAAEMHDKKRDEIITQVQQQEAMKKQAFEDYQKGVADSIAVAKNSSLRVFVDDNVVGQVSNGSFIHKFVKEDGVTPTPEATTLYLKALHFDPAVKAAEARGYERGRQQALLEATSRQPAMSRAANRDPGAQPMATNPDDAIRQILMKAGLQT